MRWLSSFALVEGDDWLKRLQQLSRNGLARQQSGHDGVGDQGVVDAGIITPPQLASQATGETIDTVAQLAGADLPTAPEGELLLQLAKRLAKRDLVSSSGMLTDQPLDVFGILAHRWPFLYPLPAAARQGDLPVED